MSSTNPQDFAPTSRACEAQDLKARDGCTSLALPSPPSLGRHKPFLSHSFRLATPSAFLFSPALSSPFPFSLQPTLPPFVKTHFPARPPGLTPSGGRKTPNLFHPTQEDDQPS